jgi:hypothetical protein
MLRLPSIKLSSQKGIGFKFTNNSIISYRIMEEGKAKKKKIT